MDIANYANEDKASNAGKKERGTDVESTLPSLLATSPQTNVCEKASSEHIVLIKFILLGETRGAFT